MNKFEVTKLENPELFISFQGAESGLVVWLNGRYVGFAEDSFTPSEFELTPYVKAGENKLAVQVFKWTIGSWCEDQDFYRFSGLFRSVFLYTVPKVHIWDLNVRPLVTEDYGGNRTYRYCLGKGRNVRGTEYIFLSGRCAKALERRIAISV